MAEVDKNLFLGTGNIELGEATSTEIRNKHSDVATKLRFLGWNGKDPCCCVILSLSADNERVEGGVLAARGVLETATIQVECNKVWGDADPKVTLHLRLDDAGIFTFSETGLSSDLLPKEQVKHGFYATKEGQAPAPILETDYGEWGIGEFCLRLSAVVSRRSSVEKGILVKWTVLLFPTSKEDMLATHDLAQSPAWPGMVVTVGEMALLPRPVNMWGCPVLPLFLTVTPFENKRTIPEPGELRSAIANIMERGVVPETARTGAALLAKWKKISNNPETMVIKAGPAIWPATPPVPTVSGRHKYARTVTK